MIQNEREGILLNPSLFHEEYFPANIIGRESQLRELELCLLPAEQRRKPLHAWIFGGSGSGKTTIAKHFLNNLEREATFLDIDVVSSTQLWQEEPDLMMSAYSFEQYHKYVKEKVEKNRGTVLNAVGDEVMAWFETPSNAIECALAIFRARNEFNINRSKLENHFQFRIGINSGLALIDVNKSMAIAKGVLSLAGHLQKEADPGTFLISEHTYNKIENKANFNRHKYIERDEIWSYIFSEIIDDKHTMY